MFETSFVGQGKTSSPWTVAVSFFLQIMAIGIAILIPMIYFDTLPTAQLTSFLVAPPPPPPPPPPPQAAPKQVVKAPVRQFDAGRLMQPKEIPDQIAVIVEEDIPDVASVGVVGGTGGVPSVGGGGLFGSVPAAAPPPPPPPVKPKPVQRIRVGGNVQAARMTKQVRPNYPPLARQARIQGTVRFNAVIGKDGTIQNLTLVSGHPLLVPAAQQAVKQWVYEPTLLNDEPVEVLTTIDVNFTLTG